MVDFHVNSHDDRPPGLPGAKGVEDEMALLHAPARGWHRPSSRGKLLGGREISLPSRVEVPPCVACRLHAPATRKVRGKASSRPGPSPSPPSSSLLASSPEPNRTSHG